MSLGASIYPRLVVAFVTLTAAGLAFFALRGGDGAKAAPGLSAPSPARSETASPPSGLPAPIARGLARNRVVVVSVYAPGSRVDELAVAEARSGARAAGAGFVAVSAFHASARSLRERYGVRSTPALVVLGRTGRLYAHLQGFADRDTVVQAAG